MPAGGFTTLEEAWIDRDHEDESLWVSHAPRVHRGAQQRPGGEARLESTIFQELYQQYNIYDTMSMNLAYDHQVMALLTLYRTRADGVFTDEEAFYLRALAGQSTMPITPCPTGASQEDRAKTLEELVQEHDLTRRETEVLGLVFQDLNNDEILEKLHISRHTLLKHLQNLYRKCGVSSVGTCGSCGPEEARETSQWKRTIFCSITRSSIGSTPARPWRSSSPPCWPSSN